MKPAGRLFHAAFRSIIGFIASDTKVIWYGGVGRTWKNVVLVLLGSDWEDYGKHIDILHGDRESKAGLHE
jgi:hypothetical protein